MADAKKPSIEEVLAACRQQDGKAGSGTPASPPKGATKGAPQKAGGAEDSSVAASSAVGEEPKSKAPAAKVAAADASKMSMADILAAARNQKGAAAGSAGATPKAAEVPAAKAAPKAAAPKGDVAAKATVLAAKEAAVPKDTGSILAAARKVDRPGPMSKEEAARKGAAEPKKSAVFVPPKPEKPAYARTLPQAKVVTDSERRGFVSLLFGSALAVGFTSLGAWTALGGLGLARFMFPNIRTEPPSRFKIGFPAEFPPDAVSTRFTAQFGVWVVNVVYEGQRQIVALKTVCTHLGCTPNWLEAEQKFKCPCHGSGFYKDGINFEGPAPRPLERYAIRIADDGQLEVDKSKKFQQEMGQWVNSACYVPV
jgi:cytochrome b6-f complex iron-sulfur subunit